MSIRANDRWQIRATHRCQAAPAGPWRTAGGAPLRPYALVQGLPGLLLPHVVPAWPSRYLPRRAMFAVLGWYALAKLLEVGDAWVFALGGVVSGHALKHLAAAMGVYWLARTIRRNSRP